MYKTDDYIQLSETMSHLTHCFVCHYRHVKYVFLIADELHQKWQMSIDRWENDGEDDEENDEQTNDGNDGQNSDRDRDSHRDRDSDKEVEQKSGDHEDHRDRGGDWQQEEQEGDKAEGEDGEGDGRWDNWWDDQQDGKQDSEGDSEEQGQEQHKQMVKDPVLDLSVYWVLTSKIIGLPALQNEWPYFVAVSSDIWMKNLEIDTDVKYVLECNWTVDYL